MSVVMTTINNVPQPQQQQTGMVSPSMAAIARRQRWQDVLFHRGTQAFSLLVLAALIGIMVSLFISAWPTFKTFGLKFLWTVEWDVVNEEFGAAISIVGTLLSAGIALLIAVPLAFGIALFLTENCPTWLRRPLGTAIELLAASLRLSTPTQAAAKTSTKLPSAGQGEGLSTVTAPAERACRNAWAARDGGTSSWAYTTAARTKHDCACCNSRSPSKAFAPG